MVLFEDYTWDDETRLTFIELAELMNKNADPLDYLLQSCEDALSTGKWELTKFLIQNAKDELKRLRESKKNMSIDAYNANQNAAEDTKRWLDCEKELSIFRECFRNPVAWAKTNSSGDLFDLRLQNNPYIDQNLVVPLYRCPNDTKK